MFIDMKYDQSCVKRNTALFYVVREKRTTIYVLLIQRHEAEKAIFTKYKTIMHVRGVFKYKVSRPENME